MEKDKIKALEKQVMVLHNVLSYILRDILDEKVEFPQLKVIKEAYRIGLLKFICSKKHFPEYKDYYDDIAMEIDKIIEKEYQEQEERENGKD